MILRAAFIGAVMVLAAIATAAIKPTAGIVPMPPDLEAILPNDFDGWTRLNIAPVVLPPEADLGPGEAVIYRAWADQAGRVVTLVIAYGPPLGDSVRLHRPETCYRAQGYVVEDRQTGIVNLGDDEAGVIHLNTEKALRRQAVTYWLRDGETYVQSAPGHQLLFFHRGLAGPADAALVRVSSNGDGASEWALHKTFLKDLVSALGPEGRDLLLADAS